MPLPNAAALAALLAVGTPGDAAPDFATEVQPILSRNCFPCHGPDPGHREEGLRLDRFEDATADRGGYRVVVPGDSSASELWLRVSDALDPMPPLASGRALAPDERETLRRWIDAGAEYAPHWALVAPRRPAPPAVADAAWPRDPLDRFVLARLEAEGLAPSPEADRATLLRRAALDLTGLPPTLEELDAFLADEAPDAWERAVDRLLASPAYGERWARVWLDLARYADSSGHGSDPLRTIWRYRDWVIDALNANLPFDRFTIEQLAGDLLPDATVDQRLATAFHRNTMTNTEGGTDDEEFRVAAVKDRAITTAQVWTGLTIGCAQCHTHKYDPVTQREFYAFYAFFDQTEDSDKDDDRPRIETPTPDQAAGLAALRAEIDALRARLEDPARDVEAALAAWEEQLRAQDEGWVVLAPTELRSAGGAGLRVLEDGSILAVGPAPERDVYTVLAEAPLERVTALRLEVLPHESLARGGPGRAEGIGNVVLNELWLAARAPDPGPGAWPEDCRGQRDRARRVRVRRFGADAILSLAEVEVWSDGRNVARGGTATQSSTAYEGEAGRAIDGNTDGHYFAGRSVTHTATEADPWWEVDLGAELEIDHVRVWNRTDGGLEGRLADYAVELLGERGDSRWGVRRREPPRPATAFRIACSEVALLARARADFSAAGWEVGRAIDGDPDTGWGLNPDAGGRHTAVFEVDGELAGPLLEVHLEQAFGAHHTLGRFRLSVTDRQPLEPPLPTSVAAALAVPREARDEAQRAALRAHFETVDPGLARLREQIAALEREVAALGVVTTPVMVELPPERRRTTRLLEKGSFLSPGEEVTPDVPACLPPLPPGAPRDRLGLARWLVSPEHPLTARVTANRYWARLFGAGLVETEEDFGTQGALPTHPELLDWLAVELVEGGWDVKQLLRTILTSATYRQSSCVTPALLVRDPHNRLYARGPRLRLEAEMVRDVLLATSGLLSRRMHGPSVFPPQPAGLWQAAFNGQRTWTESTGEDRWRRGVYVFLRRTVPYPAMAIFDAPSRETCTLRRGRTNTPLQAFVTLNDPVYVEAAQALARRIVREGGATPRARVEHGLRLALTRPPDAARAEVLLALYEEELAAQRLDPDAARRLATEPLGPLARDEDPAELAAWTVVAGVLLNQDAVLVKE